MLFGVHSEDMANALPAPPVDLLTNGADVSPVVLVDLFVGYFHRPVDLLKLLCRNTSRLVSSPLVISPLVIRHVSHPYSITAITFDLKNLILVLSFSWMLFHMFLSCSGLSRPTSKVFF